MDVTMMNMRDLFLEKIEQQTYFPSVQIYKRSFASELKNSQ